jgi:hypothetical protein
MPFTISHAVAVLPVVMPYFVPPHRGSGWSQSPTGPFTIDLAMGLVAFALWRGVLQKPLSAMAPAWISSRLPVSRSLQLRSAPWVIMSVTFGALTHVVWDTFTHRGRWGTRHLSALNLIAGGLPVYKWLQFGSGAFGLITLTLWCVGRLRRAEPHERLEPSGRIGQLGWGIVIGTLLATSAVTAATRLTRAPSWEAAAFQIVTTTMGAVAGAVVVACLIWHATERARD